MSSRFKMISMALGRLLLRGRKPAASPPMASASGIRFRQLNDGWNAEPNAVEPKVEIGDGGIVLAFGLNHFAFAFSEGDVGKLRFDGVRKYRLGSTNDEGWYRGQCRYSKIAPSWGEFYEIEGDDPLRDAPDDWHMLDGNLPAGGRHFLFYFRDETFECIADNWCFAATPDNALPPRAPT